MSSLSRQEKSLATVAVSAVFCFCYWTGTYSGTARTSARSELPVGQIRLATGDTRWKGESQAHHFRTWQKQRLYHGDALYAGVASRMVLDLGLTQITMLPQTQLTVGQSDSPWVKIEYGDFELALPAGERVQVSDDTHALELASVNGGRLKISNDGGLHVINLSGDLLVRTKGQTPINIPEDKIFRADRSP